jgi:medium-chain acyl-[acyl-carrier-protein] hydrolase
MPDGNRNLTIETTASSPWLPFGGRPDAAIRLICLPHAGAGASVYRAWGASLPDGIAACPVQMPGREQRRREPLLHSAIDVARQLAPCVVSMIRAPYAIFGHSTGALCTFELCREIRRLGGALPSHLFVAGRRAPQLPMPRTELASLQAAELAAVLRRLGGTPEDVLMNPSILMMIQPMLAADFTVNEAYTFYAEAPLDVPMTAFAGIGDPGAGPDDMAGWRDQTTAPWRMVALNGGHFAIFDNASIVQQQIATDLAAWS